MGSKNHSRLLSLGLLLALGPVSASAREVRIYVTDSGGDRVEVIDPTTNKVVQVIGGIAAPHGVGFSPDGSRIYISNESKNALDIVDRASGQITDEVALSEKHAIAIAEGGRMGEVRFLGDVENSPLPIERTIKPRRRHAASHRVPDRRSSGCRRSWSRRGRRPPCLR